MGAQTLRLVYARALLGPRICVSSARALHFSRTARVSSTRAPYFGPESASRLRARSIYEYVCIYIYIYDIYIYIERERERQREIDICTYIIYIYVYIYIYIC